MNPSIDFYLLKHTHFDAGLPFVCQLVSQVYQHNCAIKIQCHHQSTQMKLDEMLWTFTADSFIPHEIYNESTKARFWILVGSRLNSLENIVIQLNLTLSNQPETQINNLERVLQIVPNDSNLIHTARQHYRFYRQQQFTINSHHINI